MCVCVCVCAQNAGFVAEIRDYLALADEQKRQSEHQQRHSTMRTSRWRPSLLTADATSLCCMCSEHEAFYQRWCSEVFDPIQRQVAAHIAKHDKQLSAFRRALFAHYLASPTASLAFPLTCTTSNAPPPQPSAPQLDFHYHTRAINQHDPTLHTLAQQQREAALPAAPSRQPLSHAERVVFDACMWDKLAATPYGRYVGSEAALSEVERGRVEAGVRQRMAELGWDEYNVVQDSGAAYAQWFGDRSGVRIVAKNKNRTFNIVSNQSTA